MQALRTWRADWRYPTTLLCVCGFLCTVRPLEPFTVPYLTGPKNLTTEQVNNKVLPVWTYSYLAVLVPVFLLTDWLRYKPVVVLYCVFLLVSNSMMRWMQGVPAMQAMQFVYGVATACELAYFSYIYSVVDPKRYRMATSYVRSVQLLGYTAGSLLGQLFVTFDLMSYDDTLTFTLGLFAVATVASCLLPMPQRSMFFHRKDGQEAPAGETGGETGDASVRQEEANAEGLADAQESAEGGADAQENAEGGADAKESAENGLGVKGRALTENEEPVGAERCWNVLLQPWNDLRRCYSSRTLLYWSLWWTLATCGFNQTVSYVQVLWEHVQPSQNGSIYNGGVEAASNLLGRQHIIPLRPTSTGRVSVIPNPPPGAAGAYAIGRCTEVSWEQWGELALGGLSGLGSASLFLMTFIGNIWVCYACYAIFKSAYMLQITLATYQIAAGLTMERYALVFGANSFAALVMQTVLTFIVVDSGGLGLGIVAQFIVYSSYFAVIAVVFLLQGAFTVWKLRRSRDRQT
ncbi:thiamine transporter 2 isoform X2 [Brachionichthys hirsutus]|uniref:thiamine transporter 2 isoform X2 n=1 Tax=Brachionichthys hirsutus TaxID=412623 RepID=UPI003604A9C1